MKLTLSVIKADVGSVAGHNRPHPDLLKQAEECLAAGEEGRGSPMWPLSIRRGKDGSQFSLHSSEFSTPG